MANKIELINVSKNIKNKEILKNISAEFESGHIYGLLGSNGSGKTKLIRTIAGLMKQSEGEVVYNGIKLYKDVDFIDSIGLIIENISLYSEFSAFENLKLLAKINKTVNETDIKNALLRVGLDPKNRSSVKKYSLGMKQKLAIAQAIMEKPNVLLFDEPTNALDSDSVLKFYDICKEEAKRGAIIIIASHNKNDIEVLCDRVYRFWDSTIVLEEI